MPFLAPLLLWARANPKTVAYVFLALIGFVIAAMVYAAIYNRGADGVWGKIDRQNKDAHHAADKAGSAVDQCYRRDGMRWDYPRGECVRAEGNTR
jgi:hypothetical protein